MTNESLNRVVSIEIVEMSDTDTPTYIALDPNKYYHCISSSYMTLGGDAFDMIPKHMKNHRFLWKLMRIYEFFRKSIQLLIFLQLLLEKE